MTKQDFVEIAEADDIDALLESAFEWADDSYPLDSDLLKEAAAPVKNVLAMLHFDYEVLNGGFSQFYYNGYDKYDLDYENAFKAAGLEQVAIIYKKAQVCFEKIKATMPKSLSLQDYALWEQDNPLDEFTYEYANMQMETIAALVKYIKDNITYFGD